MSAGLSTSELDSLRRAGSILRKCLLELSGMIKPGVTTKTLDEKAEKFIRTHRARPAFKGYKGYPATICASRNNVVVHGIPSDTEKVTEGDIISVDVGVECDGVFADGAKTFAVGRIKPEAQNLMNVTLRALDLGIEKAVSGNRVQDISWAIQSFVESNGFSVVRVFVGHGIGKKIHEDPEVPNFGKPNEGRVLQNGMTLAIEPMVNEGLPDIEIADDGWTAVTKDKKLSAHFEHTIIVRNDKAEIVT